MNMAKEIVVTAKKVYGIKRKYSKVKNARKWN